MRLARGLLIVSYGLFTIVAQTLLFREFLTAFEGNDISVGVFFGSWLLWVGVGAVVIRRWSRLADALLRHIELLFLVYVPALVVQLLLIVQVRELAGVASYELMSVQGLLFWSLLVNAPLSFVTGLLFPLACRWVERTQSFPVSRVYVLEAVGSFIGGIAVTLLLVLHVDALRILFLAVVALSASVLWAIAADRRSRITGVFVPLLLLALAVVCLVGNADRAVSGRLRLVTWTRLLPRDSFRGVLHTAQAEYLYGEYRGQWVVVRDGAACETLPNLESAGQTAAVALCQKPDARRVLVIGSGLALCRRFLSLPQIEQVAWAHADGEYVARVQEHVPPQWRIEDSRFQPVAVELRRYLRSTSSRFDLVVLSLPDVTSSAFNRYFTMQAFTQVKAALSPGGLLAVSIVGGENVLGAELAGLGGSVKLTLAEVFTHLVLVPGDETWLLASDSPDLTGDPATLRDRFAAVPGAQDLFPPAGLLSVYLPDRAAQAMERYEKTGLPKALLVNRDERPLTHLYGLLLASRQSGASVTQFVRLLALSGLLPFLAPIAVFLALRTWSLGRGPVLAVARPTERQSSFDSSFLLFSTGWAGIAVVIVLMYLYETRFGSLYLHVGVISSLFMAGLTVGAVVVGWLIRKARSDQSARVGLLPWLLLGVIVLHGLALAGMAWGLVDRQAGYGSFAAAFALAGLCSGGYWPLAAARLAAAGYHSGEAGSRLETADHLGACLGGLTASVLMVPVLGARAALLVLASLLLANVPGAVAPLWRRKPVGSAYWGPAWLRYAGYALLGVAACVVIGSNSLMAAARRWQPALPDYAVRALAGEQNAKEASATLPESGRAARYFVLSQAGGPPSGYVFSSADFAPDVRGFAGGINLAMHIDSSGTLLDFLIVQSNETPSYLDLLRGWLDRLKGRELLSSRPFTGIDTVTGATISSQAVLATLQESARKFSADVLGGGRKIEPSGQTRSSFRPPDSVAVYLLAVFAAAVLVTLRGGFQGRLAVLVLTLVVGGLVLNAQYSIEQIVTLLSLNLPPARISGAFVLVVGVPLLVLLFGNLYCGYVCPFGAAQELLGYILPRLVRYAVLFVLVAGFFLSRSRLTVSGDPLILVFGLRPSLGGPHTAGAGWSTWMWFITLVALVGSLFVVRFWCRYLCPAGAFLSLLNRFSLLRRWLPAKRYARCEFALMALDRGDCIHCDRCRYPAQWGTQGLGFAVKPSGRAPAPAMARSFAAIVLIVGVLMAGVSIRDLRRAMPAVTQPSTVTLGAAGQPRDVDLRRVRALIEQGRLSDEEARHYKKLDEAQPAQQSSDGR
jgi:spermidine synthase/Na+-translocating ferredoxin:NAD+ oxidoreductase RnfG subunit